MGCGTRARATICLFVLALLATLAERRASFAQSFVTFETGQVRPLALSPDGSRLFAINTPDNRLEIFTLSAVGIGHTASVVVGMEPIAVAARTNSEVWVINHLSDSVSIVDVGASPPRVVRTLLVGDEPRDIVFAGPGGNRAFITTAHRGQNSPVNPQLTTEGVGRADVWVFDATNLGATLGGTPLTILTLFGDTPRALAVSPNGNTVYAAVFHSGNQTTTLSEGLVCNGGASAGPCNVAGFAMPGGLPAPNTNFQGIAGPETGLIVKFNPGLGQWQDQLGRNWNNAVRFSLPDLDVFAINAAGNPPVQSASFAHVGTILFNMTVNPVSGKVYVSNTEAVNEVRFEGPGNFGGTTVRGHLHEARITVLDGSNVNPRHLNKHIDYDVVPSPASTRDRSLATPVGLAVTSNGATLYVAAFGSSKIGVFSTTELENDSFVPDSADQITLSGGGPSGLVLDDARGRLYVLTRFDNSLSVVRTDARVEIAHLPLHNPEPSNVVTGRRILYDARATSSNGEASCAGCHVFGDFDSLGWDLGNPDDTVLNNPNPIELNGPVNPDFHPLKGPMTTQSLRGMANHGPMHWRGDRTGGNDPGGDPLDEFAAFKKFIVAFAGLLGRNGPISDQEMSEFASFILDVTYPPNPIRTLDNSLTPDQQTARNLYFGRNSDGVRNCNGCHTLNTTMGFFGTDGDTSFENEPQLVKIPHLRNEYQKVGMFGMPGVAFFKPGNNGNLGDQVRGFGFLHDGSVDTLFRFHGATVFDLDTTERSQMESFMLAFDSNLAPIVGQQITLTSGNSATVGPRIDLMIARDVANECELTVKGIVAGQQRGAVRIGGGLFRSDRASEALLSDAQVRALAATPGQELTYTCVPPGSGTRVGVDRDGDGFFDRDELDAGSSPDDATSTPANPPIGIRGSALTLRGDSTLPISLNAPKITFKSARFQGVPSGVVPPAPGSSGDPTSSGTSGRGARLTVYNAAGKANQMIVNLPVSNWKMLGSVTNPTGFKYSDPKRELGPITSVIVKDSLIQLSGSKAGWLYGLDNPLQGSVAVRLSLGSGVQWCAVLPAKTTGNPPSSANTDKLDKFIGATGSPPPAVCPPVP